jgi:hypothetical protein
VVTQRPASANHITQLRQKEGDQRFDSIGPGLSIRIVCASTSFRNLEKIAMTFRSRNTLECPASTNDTARREAERGDEAT